MDPLTAIAAAKGIAKLTGFDNWLSEKLGAKTAEKIVQVAQVVTGETNPEAALAKAEADAALQSQIRDKLLEHEHEINMALFEDRNKAREMYQGTGHQQADIIANQIIKQNHWLVFLLLLLNGLAFWLVDDENLALVIGNASGFSINALWAERQQVIGFFFGSSWGSKLKDQFKAIMPGSKEGN
ncbi:hypothetical protein R50073_24560 [Maricurvus nonylphenolicus]|uniref:hypothetical protein n=1 Tax=Maricurvus nonylphenolicus TaxID=1008307 RepID=UPI0036F4170B